MDLQQLAQVGEFLGGLSVLLTLIYLAVQIRGNTKAVRSAAAQQTHDSLTDGYYRLAQDVALNRIFRAGTKDIKALSDDELGQFFAFWSGTLYVAQNWLYQRNNGALDEELVMTFLHGVAANFHADGFKEYWNARRDTFSPTLQEWVDGIMSNAAAQDGWTPLGLTSHS
jgi:hypothetical protein